MLALIRLIIIAVALLVLIFGGTWAFAETIASMPNKGGGKIVLTNEVCVSGGKTYKNLNRAYNYTSEGYGSEGCFTVEDETVIVIWDVQGSPQKMRYPIDNFTLTKKSSKGYGT